MKNKKPFKIEPIIIAYNILMVILSAGFFYECGRYTYFSGNYNLLCQPVDYSNNETAIHILHIGYWYLILKIIELMDTVFFVLKKNNRQISNLHVIHHSLVVIWSAIGIKYVAGGQAILFGLINCFVHIIMYSYYCLAAMGPNVRKYLWWKKYLTQLQMSQFIVAMIHGILPLFYECGYNKTFSYLITGVAILFFALFSNFYIKNYNKKSTIDINNNVKKE